MVKLLYIRVKKCAFLLKICFGYVFVIMWACWARPNYHGSWFVRDVAFYKGCLFVRKHARSHKVVGQKSFFLLTIGTCLDYVTKPSYTMKSKINFQEMFRITQDKMTLLQPTPPPPDFVLNGPS